MRSRTPYFDRALARDYLRRFWPIWAGYFLLLILLLPVALMSSVHGYGDTDRFFNGAALSSVQFCAILTAFVTLLSVMAVFGWMYEPKSCTMISALPLSRPTLFWTATLTAVGLCLAALVLTALLTLAVAVSAGRVELWALGEWLGLGALAVVGYFGFALFCAMLTGNLLVLPLVWLLLGCAATVAESCARQLLNYFIYGLGVGANRLGLLSPLPSLFSLHAVRVFEELDGIMTAVPDRYLVTGASTLVIYAAAGAVLTLLALRLFLRRPMERAGDSVAYDVLRPIFRLCMAIGCALVLPAAAFSVLFSGKLFGLGAAALLCALSCLAAFLGWYAAEMIMRKTTAVFFVGWKRLALLCAAIVLLYAAGEFDLFGVERRVPDPSEVECVNLYNATTLTESGNIAAACALQRDIISHKAQNEAAAACSYLNIGYTLKNGKTLSRCYRLPAGQEDMLDPASDFCRYSALLNSREAILSRTLGRFDGVGLVVTGGSIGWEEAAPDTSYRSMLPLSADEARELLELALIPDLEEGTLGLMDIGYVTPRYFAESTDVSISISGLLPGGDQRDLYLTVQTISLHTVALLRERYGIEPVPIGELHPAEGDILYG